MLNMYCILELKRGITIPQAYMAKWAIKCLGIKNCQYDFGTSGIFGEAVISIEVNEKDIRYA